MPPKVPPIRHKSMVSETENRRSSLWSKSAGHRDSKIIKKTSIVEQQQVEPKPPSVPKLKLPALDPKAVGLSPRVQKENELFSQRISLLSTSRTARKLDTTDRSTLMRTDREDSKVAFEREVAEIRRLVGMSICLFHEFVSTFLSFFLCVYSYIALCICCFVYFDLFLPAHAADNLPHYIYYLFIYYCIHVCIVCLFIYLLL